MTDNINTICTKKYVKRIADMVWSDGVREGRSATDPEWYITYMKWFISSLEREMYELAERMWIENDESCMEFKINSEDLEKMMMNDMSVALALYLYGKGMSRECATNSLRDSEKIVFNRIVRRSEHRKEI